MPTAATLTLPIINPFTKLHATVRDKIRQQTPNFTLYTNKTKKYVYIRDKIRQQTPNFTLHKQNKKICIQDHI
jgi:hypothetical protein